MASLVDGIAVDLNSVTAPVLARDDTVRGDIDCIGTRVVSSDRVLVVVAVVGDSHVRATFHLGFVTDDVVAYGDNHFVVAVNKVDGLLVTHNPFQIVQGDCPNLLVNFHIFVTAVIIANRCSSTASVWSQMRDSKHQAVIAVVNFKPVNLLVVNEKAWGTSVVVEHHRLRNPPHSVVEDFCIVVSLVNEDKEVSCGIQGT